MSAPLITKTPALIMDKLEGLINKLIEAKNIFEKLASTFKNNELGQSVISIAQESKQYAIELNSQLQSLGAEKRLTPEIEDLQHVNAAGEKQWMIHDTEKDALKFCANHEDYIVKAYREVLHEPFLQEGIKKMVRYQLNGILFAFSRLKLLNASLSKA
jgi:uncharacterized protein (TIGR02284 family)